MVYKTLSSGLPVCHHATLLLILKTERFTSFVFLNNPLLFFFWAFVAAGPSTGNVLWGPSLCGQLLLLVAHFYSSPLAPPPP